MRPCRSAVLGATLALCAVAGAEAGAPSVPTRDTVVETQLLPRAVKASVQRLAAADGNAPAVDAALAAARRMIESGRASGDPRTLGYAESLLAPWPADDARTPPEVLVLRATIEQSRHRFDAATALLDRVIDGARPHAAGLAPAAVAPDTLGQALLTRAAVAQVRGAYAAAARDCQRLRPLNADVAAVCGALTDAATGHNERALATLRIAAARTEGAVRGWALGALAQVHEQRGEPAAAAQAYRTALAADDDLATRLAFADLLLAQRARDEARALLAEAPPADGVLLRRWQLARADGADGAAAALQAQLQARIDEAGARGDLLHAREAALFALERGDAAAALRLAQANWQTQREPADLHVLARAARAAREPAALATVRRWVRDTGLADARLRAVLDGGGA